MKIIDLLNKIANDGEIPRTIKYKDKIWEYENGINTYVRRWQTALGTTISRGLYNEYNIYKSLNDEVEIIEDKSYTKKSFKLIEDENGSISFGNGIPYRMEEVEETKTNKIDGTLLDYREFFGLPDRAKFATLYGLILGLEEELDKLKEINER